MGGGVVVVVAPNILPRRLIRNDGALSEIKQVRQMERQTLEEQQLEAGVLLLLLLASYHHQLYHHLLLPLSNPNRSSHPVTEQQQHSTLTITNTHTATTCGRLALTHSHMLLAQGEVLMHRISIRLINMPPINMHQIHIPIPIRHAFTIRSMGGPDGVIPHIVYVT